MSFKKKIRLGRDGNALVEFALCLPVLLIALFAVITCGLWFDRYMTVLQVGRAGASMFSRGMDFSADANRDLFLLSAQGLGITKSGGKGVIYLSRLVQAPPGSANEGSLVTSERYVIGNPAIRASSVGTPSGSIWPDPGQPTPNGDVKDYQDEASAVATAPASLMTLPLGESMFVAEVYHDSQDLNFGQAYIQTPTKLSASVYY